MLMYAKVEPLLVIFISEKLKISIGMIVIFGGRRGEKNDQGVDSWGMLFEV